jgi:hypothetical protein
VHQVTAPFLTDVIVDAARMTSAILKRDMGKLATRGHLQSAVDEAKRAMVMDMLADDIHLCEMLAGRIHQISAGVKRD